MKEDARQEKKLKKGKRDTRQTKAKNKENTPSKTGQKRIRKEKWTTVATMRHIDIFWVLLGAFRGHFMGVARDTHGSPTMLAIPIGNPWATAKTS